MRVLFFLVVFLCNVLFSEPSFATIRSCVSSTGITALMGVSSVTGGTANIIGVNSTTGNCPTICQIAGFARGGYIEYGDKELLAIAMSNHFSSPRLPTEIVWDDSAPAKGATAQYLPTPCRILSISF